MSLKKDAFLNLKISTFILAKKYLAKLVYNIRQLMSIDNYFITLEETFYINFKITGLLRYKQ